MSRFYTNIARRGNSILYMGYDNGLPVKQKIKYRPHLFVNDMSGTSTQYVAFSTKCPVKRIDFDSITDMASYVETYEDVDNFHIYGCSDVIRQFTASQFHGEIQWDYDKTKIWFFDIETRVEGLNIPVDSTMLVKFGKQDPAHMSYTQIMRLMEKTLRFSVLEDGVFVPIAQSRAYVAGFPEPAKAEQEILLISMIDHHAEKMYLWANKNIENDNDEFIIDHVKKKLILKHADQVETNHKHVNHYDIEVKSFNMDEKSMLKDFVFFWKHQRIDVISGWNSEGFDIPYLVNRMKIILGDDLTNFLSPWGVIKPKTFKDAHEKVRSSYDIVGITHLDYMDIYKKFNPGTKESFKLDFIAGIELGHGKKEMPGDSFKENYCNSWDQFVLYNVIDTHLLHQLELQIMQVRLAMQIAFYAKCNFGDVVSAMRVWESIIYNYFMYEMNIVEDYKKKDNIRKSIVGAYVHEPIPGKYGWTVSIDATSLYPSIMMQNNTSPETIVGKINGIFIDDILAEKHIGQVPEGCIVSANGLVTKKGQAGFIPVLVKRMFDLRKQTKNKMLEKKKELEGIKNRLTELGVQFDH